MAKNNYRPHPLIAPIIAFFQVSVTLLIQAFLRMRYDFHGSYNGNAIDSRKRYVIAANHQTKLDPFAICSALSFADKIRISPTKFMLWPKYYDSWRKPFMFLLGCFPAHNKEREHSFAGVEGSIDFLRAGYNVFIFPEGKRTRPGETTAHSGVSRILEGYPDAVLILAHIQWNDKKLRVTLTKAPPGINHHSPDEIMNAIYAL